MTDPERPPFRPDYDWTATCPHDGDESVCPDECRCECHAVVCPEETPR